MGKYVSFLCLVVFLFSCSQENKVNDFVIVGARVIDPETGLDEVCNVGILGDRIAAITSEKIEGKQEINGKGKVLSPGFIDLHAHGQSNIENEYQAFDGVTTALELEVGIDTLEKWMEARKGNALLNFGAAACQLGIRNRLIGEADSDSEHDHNHFSLAGEEVKMPLLAEHFDELESGLLKQLKAGAIGIGVPVGYIPEASLAEISWVYQLAGKWQVPVFSHVREGGGIAFQQAIADAVLVQAPLHICHLPSMARKDVQFCLDLVRKAQQQGYQITTELYPYTAGNTEISSAIFDEGWEERLGCSYSDLQWVETGERLTEKSFQHYRRTGGSVIVHMLRDAWVDSALVQPFMMIASDGGEYSPLGHPRGSGTFTKILRKYVREKGLISLPEAIKKMTLMPARVIEKAAPEMKFRGRIQVGCYADLILFDPNSVRDLSTYATGFVKAQGMDFVWVNGRLLIAKNKLVKGSFPGTLVRGEVVNKVQK